MEIIMKNRLLANSIYRNIVTHHLDRYQGFLLKQIYEVTEYRWRIEA